MIVFYPQSPILWTGNFDSEDFFFSKVMQTLDHVELPRIFPTLLVFRLGYVNTEKVLYCLNSI